MNYPIADFLIRLKNAYMARKKEVVYPYSKVILSIGKILKEEGYVKDIKETKEDNKKNLEILLLFKNRKAALNDVAIISKPSVHIYVNRKHVPSARGGFGISIVSTSKGLMTDKKARKEHIGGEVLCKVF